MIKLLKKIAPVGSRLRWILSGIHNEKLTFLISFYRSIVYSFKLTGEIRSLKVRISNRQKLQIQKGSNAQIIIKGVVSIAPWGGEYTMSSISIGNSATFIVDGDLIIGPGVHISVSDDAYFRFGGRAKSSGSGVTCNTRIMVKEKIDIGYDTIISWGVYITDSDWHQISWGQPTRHVIIGDNVWISHDVSILKGSVIGDGCIIGAKTLISGKTYTARSLIAGSPSKVIREEVDWSR